MPIRKQSVIEDALLEFLAQHNQPVQAREAYEYLAKVFNLTMTERQQRRSSGDPRSAWENLIQFAKRSLNNRGLLETAPRGFWGLSDAGRQLAEQHQTEGTIASSADFVADGAEVDIDAPEGRRVLRAHLVRERSKSLVKAFKASLSDLTCKACGFDFGAVYGEFGEGYIEAHQTIPVHNLRPGTKTSLKDLIALCSNCHRIVHRNGLISLETLRVALRHNRKR